MGFAFNVAASAQHRVAAPHEPTQPIQTCCVIGFLIAKLLNVFLVRQQARLQPFPLNAIAPTPPRKTYSVQRQNYFSYDYQLNFYTV